MRRVGRELFAKDAVHLVGAAAPRGGTPLCRRAERSEVQILDPTLAQMRLERRFGKTGTTGHGYGADVDEGVDLRLLERVEDFTNRRAFVADGGECWHVESVTSPQPPPPPAARAMRLVSAKCLPLADVLH